MRPTYLEIDLGQFRKNFRLAKQQLAPGAGALAVVKANAYGMGSVAISRVALEEGCAGLAVAIPEEGVALREAGITGPIYILGLTRPESFPNLAEYDLIPAICESTDLESLQEIGATYGKQISCMIAVDTGMHRIGVRPSELRVFVDAVKKNDNLQVHGFFSHMAEADSEDLVNAKKQVQVFTAALKTIDNIEQYVVSMANSAGTTEVPESHFTLARPGIILYGAEAASHINLGVKPIFKWISQVIHIQTVNAGERIGYGGTYLCNECIKVATIPLGYADGYSRLLSNQGYVLIQGQRCPIVGRVCMDQFMVKLPETMEVHLGDEVVLLGEQGEEVISIEEVCEIMGTIPNEVLCGISERVPRVYVER